MSDWDRQTTTGAVGGPHWVSAAEAADVAGVTPGTVRYWARSGLIVSEVVEGPAGEKTLVRLDEVLQHARREEPSRQGPSPRHAAPGGGEVVTDLPARTSELAPILESVPEMMAQLTAAVDRAARAETKVEFLSAQVADLRRRLAEGEAAGAAPAAAVPEAWTTSPHDPGPVQDDAPVGAGEPLGDIWDQPPAPPAPPQEEPAPPGPPAPAEEDAAASSREWSLDEIWNQPATPEVAREEDPAGVHWHEPAGSAARPEQEPSAPARPANAPIPEDDFYGPRPRRWFRRRR